MTDREYTAIARAIFIEDLRSIHAVSQSNVYRSLADRPMDLDAVRQYSTAAIRHGIELGFSDTYINECLRYAFETGIQKAVAWADENITMNPHILAIWKEVI